MSNDLKARLEAEGWKFLGNFDSLPGEKPQVTGKFNPLPLSKFDQIIYRPTDSKVLGQRLRSHFQFYPEVRTEDAYTRDGEAMPESRAVYVRGEQRPQSTTTDPLAPDTDSYENLIRLIGDAKRIRPLPAVPANRYDITLRDIINSDKPE